MASATGFGTPPPPQWTGVQTLVQNWLKSKSPEYQNMLAQQAKENEFRTNAQNLAQQQFQDTHATALLDQQTKQYQLGQYQKQIALQSDPNEFLKGSGDDGGLGEMGHDMYGNVIRRPTTPAATPNQDESVPTGNDVGQEMAPTTPASGANAKLGRYNRFGQLNPSTVAPGEPSSFKNPQQPSSQTTTTLPKSDQTETAPSPSAETGDNGFDYNIYGFKVGTGKPGDVHASNPKTTFSRPQRQIPSLKGDQKASNEMPDVPSTGTTPQPSGFGASLPSSQPDTRSGGAAPRGENRSLGQATTASSAASPPGNAAPEPDAMQFGIHGKQFTSAAVRGESGEASHDASTKWEELSPSEQKKVIAGYQKLAPAGTVISPTEAVMAYRRSQMARSGFGDITSTMYPSEMTFDENGYPKITYKSSALGGTGMSEEGLKLATPVLEKVNADPAWQAYVEAHRNSNGIRANINAINAGMKAEGVADKTIMQQYMQTIAPRVKFSEQNGEMIGGKTAGIPDELSNIYNHVIHGGKLTPEVRESFAQLAEAQVAQHLGAANESVGSEVAFLKRLGMDPEFIPTERLKLQRQVKEPGTVKGATGTSPRVGNGTVEGSAGTGQSNKVLDAATAQKFLDQAKGDNARARELARSAGYDI